MTTDQPTPAWLNLDAIVSPDLRHRIDLATIAAKPIVAALRKFCDAGHHETYAEYEQAVEGLPDDVKECIGEHCTTGLEVWCQLNTVRDCAKAVLEGDRSTLAMHDMCAYPEFPVEAFAAALARGEDWPR
jgi:hypothetical protein